MPTITGTKVMAMTSEWKFLIERDGCTGLRKYQDDYQDLGVGVVELPSIGDAWSTSWPNCRVERIEIAYLGDNDLCPQIYTVHYKTIKIDTQALLNDKEPTPAPDDLVISLETSSEFISVQPAKDSNGIMTDTGFKWDVDGEKIEQPIYLVVNLTTVKVQREIVDLNDLINASWLCIGKINSTTCLGAEPGTLLYTGFSTPQPVRSETETIKWRTDLVFVHRMVTGIDYDPSTPTVYKDGWNFILRENRKLSTDPWWQTPIRYVGATAYYLYDSTTFDTLFTAGAESIDEITDGDIPEI